jgi:hypothetical protein
MSNVKNVFGLPGRRDPAHARHPHFCQSFKGCVLLTVAKARCNELQTARLLVESNSVFASRRKNSRSRENWTKRWLVRLGRSAFAGELSRAASLIPGNYLPCLSFDRRLRTEWHPPVFEADLDCLLSILEIRQAANFEPVQHQVI